METISFLKRRLLLVAVLLLSRAAVDGYRPVILMHGILNDAESLQQLVNMITRSHNGTQVLNVDAFNDLASLDTAMWQQVDGVYEKIKSFMSAAENGVNMICFSQGKAACSIK